MLAAELLREKRAQMSPKEVHELAMLATSDANIAEREWARQIDWKASQKDLKE